MVENHALSSNYAERACNEIWPIFDLLLEIFEANRGHCVSVTGGRWLGATALGWPKVSDAKAWDCRSPQQSRCLEHRAWR